MVNICNNFRVDRLIEVYGNLKFVMCKFSKVQRAISRMIKRLEKGLFTRITCKHKCLTCTIATLLSYGYA